MDSVLPFRRKDEEKGMSAAIWGEPGPRAGEAYPIPQLKRLLGEMLLHFTASGACLALYNETSGQMEIRLHLRAPRDQQAAFSNMPRQQVDAAHPLGRITVNLVQEHSPAAPSPGRLRRPVMTQPLTLAELEEVAPEGNTLFPVGTTYPLGQELIGYAWQQHEACLLSREEYLLLFQRGQREQGDGIPNSFMAVPLQMPRVVTDETPDRRQGMAVYGVVVLYQSAPDVRFAAKQRGEVMIFGERIALFIQNEQLRRQQRRTSEYLRQLQNISAAFPATVHLADLVEKAYRFAANTVDVSSMLITIFDRDTKKIYDIFAVKDGKRVEGPAEQLVTAAPWDRPMWWKVVQEEQRALILEPPLLKDGVYDELLTGTWGDQHGAGTVLLLPMKIFNRVTGSLCFASKRPNAYRIEEVQVLETMTQIVAVNLENARLYSRDRQSFLDMKRKAEEARQWAEQLAAMNSALQSISSVLDIKGLLHKLVEATAKLVQAELSMFFLLSPDKRQLIARSIYSPSAANALMQDGEQDTSDLLISQIRLPFAGTLLEQQASETFFYMEHSIVEELAGKSEGGGAIFLGEVPVEQMMMIPVIYQAELIGLLAVQPPPPRSYFRPAEVGVLLGFAAHAAIAIREAQLFEELQEKNVELQRMNTLKDEFLVTASHELRTPLTAISGYASLLKRQSSRPNPQKILQQATKIAGAAQQLTDMLQTITDATKVGMVDKKLELQMGPVQLRSAVDMAINFLSVNIEQQISARVSSDMWASGDPLRVRQVLTNLLDNAAKYSAPNTEISLTVEAHVLGEVKIPDDQRNPESAANLPVALVRVRDEGEGIDLEDQQRIFEKFVRASRSLTTAVRGTGLGLFICRRYIEAMGGRLWLEWSAPGEGSMFSFYLPRIDPPVQAPTDDENDDGQARI